MVMFDIEAALVGWLAERTGVPAFGSVPEDKPPEFLTVERTGGATALGIDRPTVAVQAWAESPAAAMGLALKICRLAVERMAQEVAQVSSCKADATYSFPDPKSRRARCQLVLDIVSRP